MHIKKEGDMSESLFLQRQSSRFLAAHPREAGWLVHEFGSDSAEELSLNYLLDCLREWHPTAITCRTALPLVGAGAFRNVMPICAASEAGALNGASEEANAYGWRGTIELIWNGQEIHCRTFSLCWVRAALESISLRPSPLLPFETCFSSWIGTAKPDSSKRRRKSMSSMATIFR
ncbi:hypothetical protein COMA2_70068 [Candidatus Nitrospira nitrificans]|uniref:Uncharacterized protein n=1 Tax=Candidatus Nitrospira nitrificans TaxID=1742973 RepID=A0A0S4LTF7_9BACT|nr:hypothetical protein COMA2_70068 [Candidatus Nitrospira nitrificans]